MKNPYFPLPVRIENVLVETEDKNIKTFTLSFIHKEDKEQFRYRPGQFAELTVFGKGEAPFGMASSPTQPGFLEFSISKVGVVTNALHQMSEGEILGVRGPFGNGYPLETLKGKNVVLIGGGFGFSTLRALTDYMIEGTNREEFKKITVIYGARRPGFLLYKSDLETWQNRSDIQVFLTVDQDDIGWHGKVGTVSVVAREVAPDAENTYALVCGPPAMIKYTLPVLKELGFPNERIFLSLEMRMKCGIGKCGRCNIGSKYVCQDGPVFSYAEILNLTSDDIF